MQPLDFEGLREDADDDFDDPDDADGDDADGDDADGDDDVNGGEGILGVNGSNGAGPLAEIGGVEAEDAGSSGPVTEIEEPGPELGEPEDEAEISGQTAGDETEE